MTLTNTNTCCLIKDTTIFGFVCAVHYYTNVAYEEANQELKSLASTTNSELLTLRDCMKNIQIECTNCDQAVKGMKEALFLAEKTQSFAKMDITEMKDVCRNVLNVLQVLIDTNDRFNNQGESSNKHLLETEKLFENSCRLYTLEYYVMGGAVGAVVGGAVGATVGGDIFNKYTLGALVGMTMIKLGTFHTSCLMDQAEIILKKICADNKKINYTDNDAVFIMAEFVGRLRDQFDLLAGKNDRTKKSESGTRVRKQVDQMITDICVFQDELYAMKEKALVNECYIQDIMELENVVDLLKF
ncbi:hypothetical protein HPULCUR_007813 [Helicostylum pulchrum]|uniref:Uncharacterized protein n=1 Tax=Helicostylum pulchrum TaxID=562976 RepID=A0ABP9Y5U8_9FUNG